MSSGPSGRRFVVCICLFPSIAAFNGSVVVHWILISCAYGVPYLDACVFLLPGVSNCILWIGKGDVFVRQLFKTVTQNQVRHMVCFKMELACFLLL